MPNVDDELTRILRQAAPRPTTSGVQEGLARRRHRRTMRRRAGGVALVALVFAGTAGAYVALDRAFDRDGNQPATQTPSMTPTPTPPVGVLGLGFPTCRETTMPIVTASGEGTAAVFTRASDEGCPGRGDGFSGVAVDVDGDAVADASYGPLEDCFFLCEAFAAPDVDGDGFSEVAVSTQGADGYGVWLFHVPTGEPAIEPIVVDDTGGNSIAFLSTSDQLMFGWVGAAAHREDAVCETLQDGTPSFVLRSISVGERDASMDTITLIVEGSSATAVDAGRETIPLDQVPGPGNELCGAPLQNSAVNFPS